MINYIAEALARILRVPVHNVSGWEITAGQTGQEIYGGRAALGFYEARMQVTVVGEKACRQMHSAFMSDDRPTSVRITGSTFTNVPDNLQLDIVLLYGKDTQHIFKALHRSFAVRGPQKGKAK